MTEELIDLTVAEAAERIRSGELAADEYFDAYRGAAAADSLNALLWTAEDAGQADLEGTRAAQDEIDPDPPLAGIPVGVLNLQGQVFMPANADSPFRVADEELASVVAAIRQKFPSKIAEKNVAAATEAFDLASQSMETSDA